MKKQIISYDPGNGEIIGEVQAASKEQIRTMVENAHAASFKWGKMHPEERLRLIEKAYAAVKPHVNDLAVLLSREMGKDIQRASSEVNGSVLGGPYIARSAMDSFETRYLDGGTRIEYRPIGVAAVISPWNYPIAMANNLIVPALMAGNAVLFKPSEETPLVGKAFAEHLNEMLPEHVLQIVSGDKEQGKALVESDVSLIAFTGSQAAGRDIMARASGRLKRLIMELGGNDPMIVMGDADIESAVRFAAASSFENAGQMCVATERIYVDKRIADDFEKRVVKLASSYKVGPWDMQGVNIGPIINADQHKNIIEHIRDAEEKGASILLGGSKQPERYINPTVISDMTPDMLIEREETFGPVAAMSKYTDIEEAVQRANNSDYGLGAVVFGSKGAAEVAGRLEAGMVGINQGVGGSSGAPWVGAKQSGFGFHGSPEGHRQFAQIRVMSG